MATNQCIGHSVGPRGTYQGDCDEPVVPPEVPRESDPTVEAHADEDDGNRTFDPGDCDQLNPSVLIPIGWSGQAGHPVKFASNNAFVRSTRSLTATIRYANPILQAGSTNCEQRTANVAARREADRHLNVRTHARTHARTHFVIAGSASGTFSSERSDIRSFNPSNFRARGSICRRPDEVMQSYLTDNTRPMRGSRNLASTNLS